MPRIGVFWFYNAVVIGRAIDLEAGEEGIPGVIDSPDTHSDLWEHDRRLLIPFPELRASEYHSVPRGRVLWQIEPPLARVYMDSVLFEPTIKDKIVKFFALESSKVKWGRDPHYSTSQKDLAELFDDE